MSEYWARKFYSSAKWRKCRESYIRYRNGLCEECLRSGKYNPGKQVHHKIMLTPETINDPQIALGFDNLELLCDKCHQNRHHIKHRALCRYTIDEMTGKVTAKTPEEIEADKKRFNIT